MNLPSPTFQSDDRASRRLMMGVVVISASLLFLFAALLKVLHSAVAVETSLKTLMPASTESAPSSLGLPREVIIEVTAKKQLIINEEAVSSTDLDQRLRSLAQEAADSKAKLMVTITAEETARYGQVIEVMNALAKAKIENVTFTVGGEDF